MDGFDDGLTATKWTTFTGSVGGTGRTGSRAQFANNSSLGRKAVATADEHATMILGCAFKALNSGTTCVDLISFFSDSAGTTHISIHQNPVNGLIIARNTWGQATVLGTTDPDVLIPNVFVYLEVKVVLHDTTGSVVIKVDGATVMNLTNIDTKNAGTKAVLEGVAFSTIQTGVLFDVDDVYLCNGAGSVNNTFLGDCSVLTRFPDGNGNYSQGTNNITSDSVNNYSHVEEQPPSTADYVAFDVTGEKDSYTFQNIPAGTVYGVQQAMYAAKSDAGARTMRNIQRIAGTDYAGVDHPLGVTPAFAAKLDMLQVSPATGVLWTATEINAAEFGTEART